MKKKPPALCAPGDIVTLKGRGAEGVLRRVDERNWAWVDWEREKPGPDIVHLFELERKSAAP